MTCYRKSILENRHPTFRHAVIEGIYACLNPSWAAVQLSKRKLAGATPAQDRVPCKDIAKKTQNDDIENKVSFPNSTAFVTLLGAYAKRKDLYRGSKLHDDILTKGLLEKCSDALVTMYAKCGALAKAQELLDTHSSRDIFTWTALVSGYTQKGQGRDALDCFERMQYEGLSPDAVTFASILKACGNIKAVYKGEQIHYEIARQGLLGNDPVLGNALVDMYAKCGALTKAQRVLKELPSRDVVSWNGLLTGYVQQGHWEHAMNCFNQMKHEGLSPDAVTYACILKACGNMRAASKGEQIHSEIARQGLLETKVELGNALVSMYAKCGALEKARRVLEELPARTVVSWSTLIAGFAEQGQGNEALACYENMHGEGLSPNAVTFACILKACGSIEDLKRGGEIHDEIVKQGLLKKSNFLGSALVDMYAKCGALAKAAQVLEGLVVRDVVCWNALIAGYDQHGQGKEALDCLEKMQREGLSPDAVTFLCALKSCCTIHAVAKGEQIHERIASQGLLGNDTLLGNALVDMYAKCGALAKAHQVLKELPVRDVVSWNALIAGYVQQDQGEQSLGCYEQMQREGLFPDAVTYLCILKACGSTRAVEVGEQIHDEIARQGLLGRNVLLGTGLVDMYAKCGAFVRAQRVLEELPMRNAVSWNALLTGYAQHGYGGQALSLLGRMEGDGLSPDVVTFSCILKACGSIGAADKGDLIHDMLARQGLLEDNVVLGTALLDMYGKCGALVKAQRVLERLNTLDIISWSSLLGACGKWGAVNMGTCAFEHAVQVGECECDASPYVLMSNVYSSM